VKAFVLTLVVALAAAPAAAAKGPSGAGIDGPGTGGGISIGGNGEGPGSPLGNLTMYAGFFPATFGQQPDPMLRHRPKGELGPRYTVTYTGPGPNGGRFRIVQDVYPYAKPSPVTYTAPGQRFFGITGGTKGGWYVADPALKSTLVAAGLPRSAPAGGSGSSFPAWSAGLVALAAAALLALAAAAFVRRRPRGAQPA
jgi:hypothetical protein